MLKCDYGNLQREAERLAAAGASILHWDVMDGHFVPNLSYGAMVIERLRPRSPLVFDAHLMISDPGRYLDDFLKAGADAVTFHVEAVADPRPLLRRIRGAGRVAGLAVNPETPAGAVTPYLDDCDLILVMTVRPGFGGQKFMAEVLPKMAELREAAGDRLISVDGGIAADTIAAAAEAGADLFVAGSAVFDAPDYGAAVADLACRAAGVPRFSSSRGG
ncbi:MAG TPA: ribulose-phosphate 3-epimerase [Planctomycetaceae bacterium]